MTTIAAAASSISTININSNLGPSSASSLTCSAQIMNYRDLAHASYHEAIHQRLRESIEILNQAYSLFKAVSDIYRTFSQQLMDICHTFSSIQVTQEYSADLIELWNFLLNLFSEEAQVHQESCNEIITLICQPIEALSMHKQNQSERLYDFRCSIERILNDQCDETERLHREYIDQYQMQREKYDPKLIPGLLISHNKYVLQLVASNTMRDQYHSEALPAVLDELEDIQKDLIQTFNLCLCKFCGSSTKYYQRLINFQDSIINTLKTQSTSEIISNFVRQLNSNKSVAYWRREQFLPPDGDCPEILSRDDVIADKLTDEYLTHSKQSLMKEQSELTSFVSQNEEVINTLKQLKQNGLTYTRSFEKLYELEDDICRKENEVRSVQIQLAGISAQIHHMESKRYTGYAVKDEEGSGMKKIWKKAVFSLKRDKTTKHQSSILKTIKRDSFRPMSSPMQHTIHRDESKIDPVYHLLRCAASKNQISNIIEELRDTNSSPTPKFNEATYQCANGRLSLIQNAAMNLATLSRRRFMIGHTKGKSFSVDETANTAVAAAVVGETVTSRSPFQHHHQHQHHHQVSCRPQQHQQGYTHHLPTATSVPVATTTTIDHHEKERVEDVNNDDNDDNNEVRKKEAKENLRERTHQQNNAEIESLEYENAAMKEATTTNVAATERNYERYMTTHYKPYGAVQYSVPHHYNKHQSPTRTTMLTQHHRHSQHQQQQQQQQQPSFPSSSPQPQVRQRASYAGTGCSPSYLLGLSPSPGPSLGPGSDAVPPSGSIAATTSSSTPTAISSSRYRHGRSPPHKANTMINISHGSVAARHPSPTLSVSPARSARSFGVTLSPQDAKGRERLSNRMKSFSMDNPETNRKNDELPNKMSYEKRRMSHSYTNTTLYESNVPVSPRRRKVLYGRRKSFSMDQERQTTRHVMFDEESLVRKSPNLRSSREYNCKPSENVATKPTKYPSTSPVIAAAACDPQSRIQSWQAKSFSFDVPEGDNIRTVFEPSPKSCSPYLTATTPLSVSSTLRSSPSPSPKHDQKRLDRISESQEKSLSTEAEPSPAADPLHGLQKHSQYQQQKRLMYGSQQQNSGSAGTLGITSNNNNNSSSSSRMLIRQKEYHDDDATTNLRHNLKTMKHRIRGNLHVVLHDFRARQKDELDLRAGCKVSADNTEDSDWWTGKCNGRYGYFPANHVQGIYEGEHVWRVIRELSVIDSDQKQIRLYKNQILVQTGSQEGDQIVIRTKHNSTFCCPIDCISRIYDSYI